VSKKTKKAKDLDPKGRAKQVKGGRSRIGKHVANVEAHVGRAVGNVIEHGVGDTINHTGQAFNRALNPPR
jgi:hypothetical protein